MNSRAKGCRGERLWRDFLKDHGYVARRGQQFSGSPDSPDVVCEGLPFHNEVKFVANLSVHKAMEQSVRDCGSRVPIVAHKKNNTGWLVTMRAEDWVALVKQIYPTENQNAK